MTIAEIRKGQKAGSYMRAATSTRIEELLGLPTIDDLRRKRLETVRAECAELRKQNEAAGARKMAERAAAKTAAEVAQADAEELARRRAAYPEAFETPNVGVAMTVSLYRSTASGAHEIVVQTNAQTLDIFISGLSDALSAAVAADIDNAAPLIAATLRNAFPIAYAISGYKADRVSEAKLLTCGTASPDASELLSQSRI